MAAIIDKVVEVAKQVGSVIVSLYCTKIQFSVMDILKAVGNFLSWMMKPIEDAMNALFSALAIELPTLPGLPWFELGLPDLSFDFLFDWDLAFPVPFNLGAFADYLKDLVKYVQAIPQAAKDAVCGVTSPPTPTLSPTLRPSQLQG